MSQRAPSIHGSLAALMENIDSSVQWNAERMNSTLELSSSVSGKPTDKTYLAARLLQKIVLSDRITLTKQSISVSAKLS